MLKRLPNLQQKGGESDGRFYHHNFFVSVLAGVVSYYICKWLDRDK